ncbi:MFS transporter [Streptomyces griseorubiginosus]|uniref:MFS transporter n=1 Tax=Streptomyces griseorubiginosus TaxID=67304 RepID=UPI0033EA6065
MTHSASDTARTTDATLLARLERLPVARRLTLIRVVIGSATFFDAYTVLVIAFAMPQLVTEWNLSTTQTGMILSAGYLGQLVGALFFGWIAERIGRRNTLLITIVLFVSMDIACLFAWSGTSMMAFRFIQGIGTGGEVPVASAYINEFIGGRKRGRFFLLYEVIFPVGLMFAGLAGYFLVPHFGWRALFIVGLLPALLTIPLRRLMPESPRWLAAQGRLDEADTVVTMLEKDAVRHGHTLTEPVVKPVSPEAGTRSDWRELFRGVYLKRTLMLWALWLCVYTINNGLITWLPTLYKQVFHLPVQTSIYYGWITSAVGVAASLLCALTIDRVGRKRWYTIAFLVATVPLLALTALGATSATQVVWIAPLAYAALQTIAFSLYLYSAELYPTRLRAMGTGFGSAWLRAGSSLGPLMVAWIVSGLGIRYVFTAFAVLTVAGAAVTAFFALETKNKSLEELAP